MRKVLKTIFTMSFIWLVCFSHAFGQFMIQAEIRPRFEVRDGFKTLLTNDQKPAYVTAQRSRLNLGYEDNGLEVFMAFQDVRIWGDEVYKTDNAVMNVYQAYAGYQFNPLLSIRLGRQELIYDNKRLLGNRNWNNVGASHDVGLLRAEKNDWKAHFGVGYNNEDENRFEVPYTLNYYKYLGFLWFSKTWNDHLSLSVMNIADGNQADGTDLEIYDRFTSGLYAQWNTTNKSLGLEAAFYYQYGQAANGMDISAYYFSAEPYYAINNSIRLILGLEYFSGDDGVNPDDTYNSFDKLYGNGHSFNGYMDYFTEVPAHTKNGGLMDAYFRTSFNTGDKTNAEITLHNFSFTSEVADTITNPIVLETADSQLGTELDIKVSHKLHDAVTLQLGYSTMFASESMEILKGGDSDKYQHWAWIMFIFKPTLFKN